MILVNHVGKFDLSVTVIRVLSKAWVFKGAVVVVLACVVVHQLHPRIFPVANAQSIRSLHLQNVQWEKILANLADAVVLVSSGSTEEEQREFSRRLQLVVNESILALAKSHGADLEHLKVDLPVVANSSESEQEVLSVALRITRIEFAVATLDHSKLDDFLRSLVQIANPWPTEIRKCAYTRSTAGEGEQGASLNLHCALDIYHTAVPLELPDWLDAAFVQRRTARLILSENSNRPAQATSKNSALVNVKKKDMSDAVKSPENHLNYQVTGVVKGVHTQVFINNLPLAAISSVRSAEWLELKNTVRMTLQSGKILDLNIE